MNVFASAADRILSVVFAGFGCCGESAGGTAEGCVEGVYAERGDGADARWVKLHVVILRPVGSESAGEPLPFLMERTPYGVDNNSSRSVNMSKPELAASGYIFVFAIFAGGIESEGQFVMNRPIVAHKTKNDVDETTDTRDTIDWLLKNVPNNNGQVGVLGVSYPGFLAMSAGIDAHPAVKAISPQAPMTNIWLGDDFFHNGAFRETYGFDYVQQLEGQKTDVRVQSKEDMFDFFLQQCELCWRGEGGEDGEPADGEGFSDAAGVYEVLAGYGGGEASDEGGGADAGGGWMVGPGGYVGDTGGVCRAGAA